MFRVEAEALHRLMYNALLFDTKSAKAFSAYNGTLKMNTSDGQVYLEDWCYCENRDEHLHQWIQSAECTKAIEQTLRVTDGPVEISFTGNELHLSPLPETTTKASSFGGTYDISYGEYAQQSGLFDYDQFDTLADARFSFNADRLRKLSLLQPKDYPVSCEVRELDGIDTPVILFTKGPTVRGAYATLEPTQRSVQPVVT